MTGKRNRNIFNALFLTAVFAVTMCSVFYNEDLGSIIGYIKSADSRYWLIGVIFVIIFIESESVIIYYMFRSLGESVKLTHCCLYSFVGFFLLPCNAICYRRAACTAVFYEKRWAFPYCFYNGACYSDNHI